MQMTVSRRCLVTCLLFLLCRPAPEAAAWPAMPREQPGVAHTAQRYLEDLVKESGQRAEDLLFVFVGRSLPAIAARADTGQISYVTVPGSKLKQQLSPEQIEKPESRPSYLRYVYNIRELIKAKLGTKRNATLVLVDFAFSGQGFGYFVHAFEDAKAGLGEDYAAIKLKAFAIPSALVPNYPIKKFAELYKSGFITTEIFTIGTDIEAPSDASFIVKIEYISQWNADHGFRDMLYRSFFEPVAPVDRFPPLDLPATTPDEQQKYDDAFRKAIFSGAELEPFNKYKRTLQQQFGCRTYFNHGYHLASTATCTGAIRSLLSG